MRTKLVLRHPWKQPPETWWTFSGAEDRIIRDTIEVLDQFREYPGIAAMVLFEDEPRSPTMRPVGAWTQAGALKLAELLPDELADVRDDIRIHYADST